MRAETSPFEDGTVGAIVNVDWFVPELLCLFTKALKDGGYLLMETIKGHGQNYLQLPPLGYIRSALYQSFDIKYCSERKAGPAASNAGSFRILAIKRNSPPI